jgi:hypothetical protein
MTPRLKQFEVEVSGDAVDGDDEDDDPGLPGETVK